MNKLKFNEGGQPVFLNDLALLQDNCDELVQTLMNALTLHEEVIMLTGGMLSTGTGWCKLSPGYIWAYGEVFHIVEELQVTDESASATPYLCVKYTTDDVRLFEDGQNRPCRKCSTLYLSYNSAGADKFVAVPDIYNNYFGLLAKQVISPNVQWYNIPFESNNGYTGTIFACEVDGFVRLRLNLSSNNTAWEQCDIFVDSTGKGSSLEWIASCFTALDSSNIPSSIKQTLRSSHVALPIKSGTDFGVGFAMLYECEIRFQLIGNYESTSSNPKNTPISLIFNIPKP